MNILFIQTGGTIDKAYPKRNKGYAFEISAPAVERILQRAEVTFAYYVASMFRKDSTEITDQDRLMLKNFIKDTPHEQIVITHGTDTLIETARFVGNIADKTIVFTAAFLPEAFKDSEADFNVGMAVGAVMSLENGTFIAMNGMLFTPEQCKKNEQTGKFEKIHE